MRITFDPEKREENCATGGSISQMPLWCSRDRFSLFRTSGSTIREERYITVGLLAERMVIVVWTPTEDGRRIISMRKANAREQARYLDRLG